MRNVTKFAFAAVFLLTTAASATITSTPTTDAETLADLLKGTNPLTITSATLGLTTLPGALGSQSEAGTYVDMDGMPVFFNSGVYLSTGFSNCFAGPNDSPSCSGNGVGQVGLTIQFDAPASVSNIGFTYIFASEEFNEFVGSQFQDTFEFRVNGVNYAVLSNGTTVTIDNVAASSNYVLVDGTSGNPVDPRTQFDGYTTTLQFIAPVNVGMNTLELFIADVGDTAYDSAVFLQAGTLEFDPDPIVPEPGTFLLLGGGLMAVVGLRKRFVR